MTTVGREGGWSPTPNRSSTMTSHHDSAWHQAPPYLEWKFQDMNLLVGSDAFVVRPETPTGDDATSSSGGVVLRMEEAKRLRQLVLADQRKSQNPSSVPKVEASKSYAQILMQPNTESSRNSRDDEDQEIEASNTAASSEYKLRRHHC